MFASEPRWRSCSRRKAFPVEAALSYRRQSDLGATLVRRMPNGTTLADPNGLEYCAARRDPSTGTLQAVNAPFEVCSRAYGSRSTIRCLGAKLATSIIAAQGLSSPGAAA